MAEGMRSVIATVTGYHGSERFEVIKLIDISGANYVGKMYTSTTHLICWEFKGKKYELAKKLGTLVLNHRWLQDCIKKGKRVPEHPYTLQSGKEVGLVILRYPFFAETSGVLAENELLVNTLNTRDSQKDVIDLEADEIENDDWDVDNLLDENLFPGPGSRKTARQRSKRKLHNELFDDNSQAKATNRRSSHETDTHRVPRIQLTSEKRRNDNDVIVPMDLPESSRRSRRLVKKNVQIDSTSFDEQQSKTASHINGFASIPSLSNNSRDFKESIEANHRRRLRIMSTASDKSEEDEDFSNPGSPVGTGIHSEAGMPSEDGSHDEYLNELHKGNVDPCTRLSTSGELSCVICHTEFSSMRGVLTCGHRFCFTCIQNWADHMVSSRKESKCPLCNEVFSVITKVDNAASLDQKIYSQTIPVPSSTQDIFIVPQGGSSRSENQNPLPSVCCNCQNRDPEDLLIYCQMCQISCIHSYCLDPPLFPWTCTTCRDRRLFYYH